MKTYISKSKRVFNGFLTLRIDETLHDRIVKQASSSQTTISELVRTYITEGLSRSSNKKESS